MKNRITNPFVTGGYIGPEYFCNRKNETEILFNGIFAKRNITLISLRRMGKTGLLKHVKYFLEHNLTGSGKKMNPVTVVYVDLMPTMNSNDMMNVVSSALLSVRRNEKNFFEKAVTLLAALRPRITYDSLTGQPVMELKVETPSDIQSGFNQLLGFITEIKKDLVIMFDEFQQISHYPEKNIEQLLRTIIQSFPSIPFIFSGSSKHMLEPMFSGAGRPFYQSADLMYLDKIPGKEYRDFIMKKFDAGGLKIDDEAVSEIFRWTRLHTFYVQWVCSLLFEADSKVIHQDLIKKTFHDILISHEPLFSSYRNLIPGHQYRLLQAIAVEDGVSQPTSGTFIKDHKLTSASSVAVSLKALSEKEMIVQNGTRWEVYDVFFSRWLQYQYGER